MTPPQGTAGTAGARYRCDDEPHPFVSRPRDYGEMEHCTTCGSGRDEPGARHIPAQRRGER